MMSSLRGRAAAYASIAAMVPKLYMAYKLWVWIEFLAQIMIMVIFVYFWRAIYAETALIGGLNLQQTLNYILMAQIILPILNNNLIFQMGYLIREGQVGVELLRPLDFQARSYVENLAGVVLSLVLKLPLLLIAWAFMGLQLPSSPVVWGAFLLTLLLGHAVLFFFDYVFSCLAFYSTEVWGLAIAREGVAVFFSGALIPLVMMPAWLQSAAHAMPFAQVIYIPTALLSGIIPLGQAPQTWLIQIAWIFALGLLSRLVFNFSVKRVTVQGG
jgi:ABC-2 type transport system permease protein